MQNVFRGILSLEALSLILGHASGKLLQEGAISWNYCSSEQSFSPQVHSSQEALMHRPPGMQLPKTVFPMSASSELN